MSEMEGRRIYCSGRDLHTINSVSQTSLWECSWYSRMILIGRMFSRTRIYPIWNWVQRVRRRLILSLENYHERSVVSLNYGSSFWTRIIFIHYRTNCVNYGNYSSWSSRIILWALCPTASVTCSNWRAFIWPTIVCVIFQHHSSIWRISLFWIYPATKYVNYLMVSANWPNYVRWCSMTIVCAQYLIQSISWSTWELSGSDRIAYGHYHARWHKWNSWIGGVVTCQQFSMAIHWSIHRCRFVNWVSQRLKNGITRMTLPLSWISKVSNKATMGEAQSATIRQVDSQRGDRRSSWTDRHINIDISFKNPSCTFSL